VRLEGRCLVPGLEHGVGKGVAGQDGVGRSGGGRGDAQSALVVSERGEVNRLVVGHGSSGERSVGSRDL
jgi:hypothetical protein